MAKEAKAKKTVSEARPPVQPRLSKLYNDEVVAKLTKDFGYKNPMQVPRIKKITINMGLGEAVQNVKIIDSALEEMKAITGRKPVVT